MNMSRGLFLALMAMDAYNREYGQGIPELPAGGSFLSSAQIVSRSDVEPNISGVGASFRAAADKTTIDDASHGGGAAA